ncbi:MAG: 4-hydroxy-tetrahydrodipicolinate reductase [Candidatus Lambdaproteobacteria bacterium RIFOXYD1_FULL_56_27]|uniref:4-hydroxy-tetrahydrodipicolinate reductase n=1 Tax=Candidatus Lambdaproteobacteria bacterium RIFOXYD2_FULL_56_26 TaxID=1817773 RepID=A0A1F6H3C1_9PROT|nr:MAG: 4-hydroxy-tetrahydrodipicolinate reductase [Candidatus Lambdaproteobacteria bacterium RIFOXYC1_FULL_56_13]OGH04875.1 MAG: 4-hydroxy-tetrahydrodipicolinate reductase [Candidatus Lambdaproteobacteria bacterium RIFOXYD2_FULL_56_26]OGH09340.1 MAG: 4-hydroxy-tetrahydrodipicolinate reductase [Candidatus Lambdaproteobacteria bacterium RIFOXYD1_FULL_56_27]
MKIALVGYGQMGQMIDNLAAPAGLEVVSRIDPFSKLAQAKEINETTLNGAEVAICFTSPEAALENIKAVLGAKRHLVMGTTGWLEHKDQVAALVAQAGVGMVYSSNFSLGVNLFFQIVAQAAKIMNRFEMYDTLALEAHHKLKKDSPSGTALTLGQLLLENLDGKTKLATERLDRRPEPGEIHFASVRGGSIPGTHSVLFDSEFDTIELTHRARNRGGFATGVLLAAKWIAGQKGFYTEKEMMAHLLA